MNGTIKDSFFTKSGAIFLYLALVAYPFSVAASSLFFGLLVMMATIQTDILKQGLRTLWSDYQLIAIAILLLILITIAGYFWSENTGVAQHKIIKQFNWFVLPAIIGLYHFVPSVRERAFIALSVGLSLHLVACTCQYYGVVTINGQGSSQADPTGFLGHLYFGFVYAVWAGGLVVAAKKLPVPWKILFYSLAIYAALYTFIAQGRSGYILFILIFILTFWKLFCKHKAQAKAYVFLMLLIFITIFFTLDTPAQDRVKETWHGVEAFLNNDWLQANERIKIWVTAIQVWENEPWFGIGTGDYGDEAKKLLRQEEFKSLRAIDLSYFDHPHNEFLFALVRWGPIGLVIVLFLCWVWLSTGWKKDWTNDTMNAYLMTSSGLSVIVLGLTDCSLNSKLSLMFSIVILSFSMLKDTSSKDNDVLNIKH